MNIVLPEIESKWRSPQGILMEVVDIHQRARQPTFLTLEIISTKRRVLRDLRQFAEFTKVE